MNQVTKRLKPTQDLRDEIQNLVKENNIQAGVIVSAVGSLSKAVLRMAGAKEVKTWNGNFEIVSITGTLSPDGCHVHLAISDEEGNTFGGHLKQGCIVRSTVELALLIFSDVKYKRELDSETGYKELKIEQ